MLRGLRRLLVRRPHRGCEFRNRIGLGVDSFGVAEILEPIETVVRAHAARADATKWQVFLCNVHDHIVDGDTARCRACQYFTFLSAILAELVEP